MDLLGAGEFIKTLVDALFYPVKMILLMISSLIDQVIAPFASLYTAVYDLHAVVYGFLQGVLGVFPSTWAAIISLGLVLVLGRAVLGYVWR